MGYVKNHAIIVTGTHGNYLDKAHAKAVSIFPWVSPISEAGMNRSMSFFIPPDGSKEGWAESDHGDQRRERFKEWLRKQEYEDTSTPLDWVEVSFGADDHEAKIIDDAHVNYRAEYCS